nr:mucin-5AC-like [Procambarus clarkii]
MKHLDVKPNTERKAPPIPLGSHIRATYSLQSVVAAATAVVAADTAVVAADTAGVAADTAIVAADTAVVAADTAVVAADTAVVAADTAVVAADTAVVAADTAVVAADTAVVAADTAVVAADTAVVAADTAVVAADTADEAPDTHQTKDSDGMVSCTPDRYYYIQQEMATRRLSTPAHTNSQTPAPPLSSSHTQLLTLNYSSCYQKRDTTYHTTAVTTITSTTTTMKAPRAILLLLGLVLTAGGAPIPQGDQPQDGRLILGPPVIINVSNLPSLIPTKPTIQFCPTTIICFVTTTTTTARPAGK